MEWDEVEPILIFYCQYQIFFMGTNVGGSGGGASGGVTAFCLGRRVRILRLFSIQNCFQYHWAFSNNM